MPKTGVKNDAKTLKTRRILNQRSQCQSRKPKETEQVHVPVFAAKLNLEKPIDDSMSNRRIHREKIEIDL